MFTQYDIRSIFDLVIDVVFFFPLRLRQAPSRNSCTTTVYVRGDRRRADSHCPANKRRKVINQRQEGGQGGEGEILLF